MNKTLLAVISLLPILNASAETLSWEDVLRYTEEGNPQIEAAKNEWLSLQSQEAAQISSFLPKISASAAYNQTGSNSSAGGNVVNGVVVAGQGSISKNYTVGLNSSINLFRGFSDSSRWNQAKFRSQSSYWNYVNIKANISYQLKEAYADLIYTQESLNLSKSILERRENNYKLVLVRYQNGRENKGSVLLAEAYQEQAKLDVLKAQDAYLVSQTRLKSLMNKEELKNLQVKGEPKLLGLEEADKSVEEFVLETPSFKQALATENVAKEEIAIARSSFLPSLDLNANVNRQDSSFIPEKERERWSVGVTLTIPLFDGLKDRNTYKSSVYSQTAAEGKKKSALLELLPKIREAQNLAKQADLKLKVDSKFREATSTRAEIARAKYNNGLITFEDWDIIENELIQRQTSYLVSKKDRIVRYANWENVLGKGSL